jgi:lysozyme
VNVNHLALSAIGLVGLYLLVQRSAQAGAWVADGDGVAAAPEYAESDLDMWAAAVENLFSVTPTAIEGQVMRTISQQGLDLLKQREGFSATPYWDFHGNSIGYGHLIKPGENLTHVTQAQAEELLRADVAWAETAVNDAGVSLTQPQFDALVSFVYNVGAPAWGRSTLRRKLVAGDTSGAAAEFAKWNIAGGKVHNGLVARRVQERSQFEGALYA